MRDLRFFNDVIHIQCDANCQLCDNQNRYRLISFRRNRTVFLQFFVQIIGGGLAALGSILLRETGDYDAMTPRDIVIPATAVLCFGVVLAFIALFGAYGASCFQAKDCLIVVRSKQKFCKFSKYLSNYTLQFTQGTKHDF